MRHLKTIFIVAICSVPFIHDYQVNQKEKEQKQEQQVKIFNDAVDNIQDVRTWINEDFSQGRMTKTNAEFYLTALNESEDLLIKYQNNK